MEGFYFDELLQRVIWVDLKQVGSCWVLRLPKMLQASRICRAVPLAPTGLPLFFLSTTGLLFRWGSACCRSPLVAFASLYSSPIFLDSSITSLFITFFPSPFEIFFSALSAFLPEPFSPLFVIFTYFFHTLISL